MERNSFSTAFTHRAGKIDLFGPHFYRNGGIYPLPVDAPQPSHPDPPSCGVSPEVHTVYALMLARGTVPPATSSGVILKGTPIMICETEERVRHELGLRVGWVAKLGAHAHLEYPEVFTNGRGSRGVLLVNEPVGRGQGMWYMWWSEEIEVGE